MIRVLAVVFLTILLSAGIPIYADTTIQDRFTPCAPAGKFIEIRVTSKMVAATPSGPARRVWVITEVPNADKIQTAGDVPVKDKILEVLQAIRDSGIEVGVGEEGNPEPAVRQLVLLLSELQEIKPGLEIRLPGGLTTPPEPADEGRIFTVRLCLDFETTPLPKAVEIQISTLAGRAAPSPRTALLTLADADPRFAQQPKASIPVHLIYGQQDLDDALRDPAITAESAETQLRRQLLEVAATAFDKAVAHKLLDNDGRPLVDRHTGQTQATGTALELRNIYNLNTRSTQMRWGLVEANVQVRDISPGSPWIITVAGLQLAQSVDVDVLKAPEEAEFDGTSAEKKFDERRQSIRQQLRNTHLGGFSAKPGRIVTAQDIDRDEQRLREDKTVKKVGEITSDPLTASAPSMPPPQNVIYTVSRKLAAEKTLAFKIGAGYSPEEALSGTAALESLNMLGISETTKLDFSGGPQVQKFKFNFSRPFEKSGKPGWEFKEAGINAQIFRDEDQRLGNLTTEEIEAREAGSEARLSFGYDSFGILDHASADCLSNTSRKRTRFYLIATPTFGYRDVNIKEDDLLRTVTGLDPSLLPSNRTQVTTLALDASLGLTHDFRVPDKAGLGRVNIYFNGRLQKGFEIFGADYKYNKASGTLTLEMFFGSYSPQDYFLRYNRIMSTATRGTPVFELSRLGGPATVPGFEEGEIIGRKLSADQFELGVNVLLLWQLIARNDSAKALLRDQCADAEGEQSSLPFDPSKAYLKFFYDLGRINDQDSFLSGNVERTVHGYGLAFEVRQLGGQNINMSIGYAYSPASRLHRSGTVYTGVSYSF